MPYTTRRDKRCPSHKPWGVITRGTEKLHGCFVSEEAAQGQQAALYVHAPPEGEKAMSELPGNIWAKFYSAMMKIKAPIKRESGVDFPARDYAYVPDPKSPSTWKLRLTESPGKVTADQLGRAAAAFSAGGFRGNRVQIPASVVAAVKRRIRAEYRKLGVPENKIPSSVKELGLSIWKSADGKYRWFAVYSNNFQDNDNPPEIISEKSHKTFVSLVDAGIVDPPELWHWHEPGTAWGKAEMVDYVDGFAVSAGYVYPGHEKEAEALIGRTDIGMSHGMPVETILRDPEDLNTITFHITKEISDLPRNKAANRLTSFVVLGGKDTMPMTNEKRKYLEGLGWTPVDFDRVDQLLKGLGDFAQESGILSKGADSEEEQAEEEAPEDQEAEEEEPVAKARGGKKPMHEDMDEDMDEDMPPKKKPVKKEVPAEPQPEYLTASQFAEVMEPILDSISKLNKAMGDLGSTVKELSESEETRLARLKEMTPTRSYQSILDRANAIGRDETRVDGRTTLGKEGPVETEAPPALTPSTPVPFINNLRVANLKTVQQQ